MKALENQTLLYDENCLLCSIYTSGFIKVIIPNTKPATAINCVPDFNYKYRILYIVFAIAVTSLVLYSYSNLISILPKGNCYSELLVAVIQLTFQVRFLIHSGKKVLLNYAGNLMTVSLMGSLLLIPILLLNRLVILPQIVILGWFAFTVLIMFAEHFRRARILQLPDYFCYTWILYRVISLLLNYKTIISMKKLKILNTIAIAIPVIISFFGLFENGVLLVALATTMLTGLLQLTVACIFWLKYPENIHVKIYFAIAALFFVFLYLFTDYYQILCAAPIALCIYLSYIIYSTPNETK